MANIGIVGAGVAGLHLGLYLIERGINPTIYTSHSSEEVRKGRLPSITALLGNARATDRRLGVAHWDESSPDAHRIHFSVQGMPELSFTGRLKAPAAFVDMRMYLPRLMEDFEQRGGRLVVSGAVGAEDLARIADAHDLAIVASGRGELGNVFARVPERSPYTTPQRRLFAGLFRGVRFPDEIRLGFRVIPGQGEIFESQFLTFEGPVTSIFIEAIPGGALDSITQPRPDGDLRAVEAAVLELLRAHAPEVHARVDASAFGLVGPLDHLQGAVLPVARRGYAALGRGRFAVALGDAHVTHDPVLGQGANAASRSALAFGEMLADRIVDGRPLDESFCAAAEDRLWGLLRPATEWTNAFLQPPPPHMMMLLAAAARDSAVADAFAGNFDDPARQWQICRSPDGVRSFLAGFVRAA
ncbi:styrene monooxygenase/indole monooxygenase family protein [Polyangium aurulentum]|uniref:styrene monooxygenase/indole monooxygenase family protein n=1 Tax=Polyangium aurulentum TaxID=2567896 RepID=UPI0010AEAC64|nr:styrene monooxygenase/indole monooxygenase family protein [Polyangium aurulentum]UQA63013.1 monooxygenase [Polyangium aurulentum]